MLVLTLTTIVPELRPPACTTADQLADRCVGPSRAQVGILVVSMILLTVGAGGIRPCSLPFGVDQFDKSTEQGRRGLASFFSWYYCTSTAAVILALVMVIYIQSSVSWALGLGIPTGLMLVAIVVFFLGTRLYVYVPPAGSVFSGIAQVFVAAYRKRSLSLPAPDNVLLQEESLFSGPVKSDRGSKLPLTLQYRCLNKAAIKCEGEVQEDGSIADPWRLCTVMQVEEAKCLLRIVPIWASGIVCLLALVQQFTFSVLQSMRMDRHIGPHFQVPAALVGIVSMIALVLFVPVYDRLLVPLARRITGTDSGITLLQRQGAGLAIAVLAMAVAGRVEKMRRDSCWAHGGADGVSPLSAMWLAPQLVLMGVAESFNAVGQIEFYNRQFPEHMQTLAGSLFYCTIAAASYVSSFIVAVIQKNTSWLNNNINLGRVENFYYIIGGMGVVNFLYFLLCAHFYHYKGVPEEQKLESEEDAKVVDA
ncbi:protein NRT1/ PTR FAMILY 2.13-like [Iris pallida]|uniref:Protein NRT1/ PTR FAMILY 2.13-like n=1 Tax=Iris pallida TaxID=29817 RepID=A0AAX6FJZ5_IRIPA|nr:protein NRT1/ PTR FAMILY 2.13-like [Iris pallida]